MIMKTLTNGMELAWHPVVGGLVEGDQGHRAAVGDVRHEPGGENMVWWRKVIRKKQIEEMEKLFMVIIKTGQHSKMDYVDVDVDNEVHSLGAWQL